MCQSRSGTRSNPIAERLAAEAARLAAMGDEERAAHRARVEAERELREAEAVARMRATTVANRVRYSGIPEGYREATFDGLPPAVGRYAGALKAGTGESALLIGPVGTGKTTAACALLLAAAKTRTVRYARLPSLLREVNGAWRSRDKTPQQAFAEFAEVGVLCLDDVGKEVPRPGTVSMLWELVDARVSAGRPTVYTTNNHADELRAMFAAGSDEQTARAIVDRMRASVVIRFEGESLRERPQLPL